MLCKVVHFVLLKLLNAAPACCLFKKVIVLSDFIPCVAFICFLALYS